MRGSYFVALSWFKRSIESLLREVAGQLILVFVVRTLKNGEGLQQRNVTGSKARKEDRIRPIGNGFAILRPGKPTRHLRFVAWYSQKGCRTLSSVEE